MTYFRNKFNREFLYLCNKQEPKGGSVRLDNKDHTFWVFRKRNTKYQPNTIHVIPLLLYNKIESTWNKDLNVEDYMMICDNRSDTTITCYYDDTVVSEQVEEQICDFGIKTITGDLSGTE